MENLQSSIQAPLLVDAHVHFHSCFKLDAFLDAALANFRRGAAELGVGGPFTGCLMFAEMERERWMLRWRRGEDGVKLGEWQIEPAAESAALIARRRSDGERLLLVAGRQVRTREGLEILALATAEEFPDGLSFHDALSRVRWSSALTVIPWGFGKWWFYRGALVESVVCRAERPDLCLGDNACRPHLGRLGDRPRLFREAEARGIPVLPGTDPLPFPEQAVRAGSYGFLLEQGFDEHRPAQSLRRTLRSLTVQPRTYGQLQSLAGFCRDQAALRLRRRTRVPEAARGVVPRPEEVASPASWTRTR